MEKLKEYIIENKKTLAVSSAIGLVGGYYFYKRLTKKPLQEYFYDP